MKIFITGGTGFIGNTLIKKLLEEGHEVTILTRHISKKRSMPVGISWLEGNPTKKGAWQNEIPNYEAIINLAGSSILGFWTEAKKKEIIRSRIETTKTIVDALQKNKGKTNHLLTSSAVGYYGFTGDEEVDEESEAGQDFLASVAKEWESAAKRATDFGVRVVFCRIGLVLGKNGGMLAKMLPFSRLGLTSPLGNGKQWNSWIHEEDIANIFLFLLKKKDIEGPVNMTAPNPVVNKEMVETIARILGKPVIFPSVPAFFIKTIMGDFGEVLLKGQRALPKRLLKEGFTFQFPVLRDAITDILRK